MPETPPYRPNGYTCICGTSHYGDWDRAWRRNWCGNQCCWNRETCRSCGAVYEAVSGLLVAGDPQPGARSGADQGDKDA